MIKKIRAFEVLAMAIAGAVLLTGCGKSDNDYSRYVTLADISSLQVELNVEPVSDEQREEAIDGYLADEIDYEYGDGPIEQGNYVEMTLTATEDGTVLYDFSEDGYELTVGSKDFGEEFDAELIGKKVGDPFALTVTYDSTYSDGTLAGKTVDYEGKVTNVAKVIKPEITDTFVKEKFGASSAKEWLTTIEDELISQNQSDARETMRDDLVMQLVEKSTISGYPKALYNEQKKLIENEFAQYASMFGCTVDEIYDMFGMDEEAFREECLNATYRAMVLTLVQQREQITLSEDELRQAYEDFAKQNEYDSVDELLADYGEEELKNYIINERTIDFLEEHANISDANSLVR
ncbi:MAG: FKBP-type peptidyl-prolyl cis-trans isomerase [bacterium]|nr:FKBP-type peptidyl-prolyl cis-trans isomerase [bacterium]